MDVTDVSPFTTASTTTFTPSRIISMAVTRKRNKYLDTCTAQGYGFQVLAFSTLGELEDDLIAFLKRLRNCLLSRDVNHKFCNSLFHRIGIVIQKGVGSQLVARLPATEM